MLTPEIPWRATLSRPASAGRGHRLPEMGDAGDVAIGVRARHERRFDSARRESPPDLTSAAIYTLRLLARRILELTEEIHDLVHRITDTITTYRPTLLTHHGIGPDTAAALLITAGDNPDRLPQRGLFCRPVRRQPPGSILGQNHPSPT